MKLRGAQVQAIAVAEPVIGDTNLVDERAADASDVLHHPAIRSRTQHVPSRPDALSKW